MLEHPWDIFWGGRKRKEKLKKIKKERINQSINQREKKEKLK